MEGGPWAVGGRGRGGFILGRIYPQTLQGFEESAGGANLALSAPVFPGGVFSSVGDPHLAPHLPILL